MNYKINRRQFVQSLVASSVVIGIDSCTNKKTVYISKVLSKERQKTLIETHKILFPNKENTPSLDDINAFEYLDWVLSDSSGDKEEQEFITNGIDWLEEESQEIFHKKFSELNHSQKNKTLRSMENYDWGSRWISLILMYIFEALLSDPIYGSNKNEIGWNWLEHKGGIPRATRKTIYPKTRYGL